MDHAAQDISRLLGLFGILGSGLIFLIMGIFYQPKKLTVSSYLKSNNDIGGKDFADSFFSAGFSLSGNILFFIQCYKLYGWLMAVGPMFSLITQLILLKTMHKISFNFNRTSTVAELCYDAFPSTVVARTIAIICALSSLMTLFLEIYMGSVILAIFFPVSPFYDFIAFLVLGLIVLGYVFWGGFKAVVKTDRGQTALILVFCLAFIYYVISMPTTGSFNALSTNELIHKIFSFDEKGLTLYIFIMWACLINVVSLFTDITIWQRMSSAISMHEVYKGLWKGAWKMVIIFWVPVLCFVIVAIKGRDFNNITDFLNIILEQSDKTGMIIFPIIILGFASALFSTADATLIGVIYALCDKVTFLPKLESIPLEKREQTIKYYLVVFFVLLLLVLSVLYAIHKSHIAPIILPIVYTIWGQGVIFMPLSLYAILQAAGKVPRLFCTKKNNLLLILGLIIGWFIILVGSYFEIFTGKQLFPQIAVFVGIVCFGLCLVYVAKSRAD